MKLPRFRAIVEAYGARPEDWPAGEREAARLLARSSLEAARFLAEVRSFNAVLRASVFAEPANDSARISFLRARILAHARGVSNSRLALWLDLDITPKQLWPSLAGLAIVTILGFGFGIGGIFQASPEADAEEASFLVSFDIPVAAQ